MSDPQSAPKTPRLSAVTMIEPVLPNDLNPMGNLLGGRLLHLIDMAAGMAAIRHAGRGCVTASFDSVDFLAPVHMGEVCHLSARVTWTGTTSIEVFVDVYAENLVTGERRHTTTAFTTFVALDPATGRPTPVPPLLPETEEEKAFFAGGAARKAQRLAHRQLHRQQSPQ